MLWMMLITMTVLRMRVAMMLIIREDNTGHRDIKDGPFPWDASIEGLLNSIVRFCFFYLEVFLNTTAILPSVGIMVGTLMTLFVYDIYNERLVFAVALGFPGFLNLLTPFFATEGGYYVTTILRFFTGLYSAILTPVIPALAFNWFLSSELYRFELLWQSICQHLNN